MSIMNAFLLHDMSYNKNDENILFSSKHYYALKKILQWGSEMRRCTDFEWWKVGWIKNGIQKPDKDVQDSIFGSHLSFTI